MNSISIKDTTYVALPMSSEHMTPINSLNPPITPLSIIPIYTEEKTEAQRD